MEAIQEWNPDNDILDTDSSVHESDSSETNTSSEDSDFEDSDDNTEVSDNEDTDEALNFNNYSFIGVKLIEDMFTPNPTDVFSIMASNSLAEMKKFITAQGRMGYHFDVRSVIPERLQLIHSQCAAPIVVSAFNGTFKNFNVPIKMYTTKTEYFKGENCRVMLEKVFSLLPELQEADMSRLSTNDEMCGQVDSIFAFYSVASEKRKAILRLNFIPNSKEVEFFHSMGAICMYPSAKVMSVEKLPDEFNIFMARSKSDTKVKTSMLPTPFQPKMWDWARSGLSVFNSHIHFFDSTKKKMKKSSEDTVNPAVLIDCLAKVKVKEVTTDEGDYAAISESIESMSMLDMTLEVVAKYLKVRSNMMEKAMADTLMVGSVNYSGQLVSFGNESFIGEMEDWLSGIEIQTPDVIVSKKTSFNWEYTKSILEQMVMEEVEDDVIYFVEIKVTDYGSTMSSRDANARYTSFCNKINNMAASKGRPEKAKVKVLMFDLSSPAVEIEKMEAMGLQNSEACSQYYEISKHWETLLKHSRQYRDLKTKFDKSISGKLSIKTLENFFGEYFMRDPSYLFLKNRDGAEMVKAQDDPIFKTIMSYDMGDEMADILQEEYIKSTLAMIKDKESLDSEEVSRRMLGSECMDSVIDRREEELTKKNTAETHYEDIDPIKVFKVPSLGLTAKSASPMDVVSAIYTRGVKGGAKEFVMRDGTVAISSKKLDQANLFAPYFKNKKMERSERLAMRPGANFSRENAKQTEELFKMLHDRRVEDPFVQEAVKEILDATNMDEVNKASLSDYCNNGAISMAYYTQMMMQDIAQLEGKRNLLRDARGKKLSSKKFSVFRKMERFTLEIMSGTLLKQGKGIRFRVWAKRDCAMELNLNGFHHFYDVENTSLCCTNYLYLYPIDLVTWLTSFESAMMLAVGFMDKHMEVNPLKAPKDEEFYSLTVRILQLLEHRNNTSAASQLSRYLMMGGTSIHADREGCIKEIGDDPIRGAFQNYTIMRQLDFCRKISAIRFSLLDQVVENQMTAGKESVRLRVPSIYCDCDVDITVLLDEIYFCNLLDPNYGSRKHMTETTFKKMAKLEMLWRERLDDKAMVQCMMGLVDSREWMRKGTRYKDTTFMFDRSIIVAATKIIMRRVSMDQLASDFSRKMFESIQEVMTLKSSVKMCGKKTIYDNSAQREMRRTAYETQLTFVTEFRCRYVVDVCNLFPHFDYYFGEFPKPQIGGPREILIQDMYTRCKARLTENFFNALNKQFPDEMTSNAEQKFVMQANMDNILDLEFNNKPATELSISMANNKDHSKWSPGANVLQYAYMTTAIGLPEKMKGFLLTAILAYSHARVGIPKEMEDTVSSMGLSAIRRDKEPVVVWMYNEFYANNMTIVVKSGWPQGMLQFCSSTYHVIEKNFMRAIWEVLANAFGVNWASRDMVTSDDTTDYMRVGADSMVKTISFTNVMLTVGYMVGTSFNMHENRKKSNLQLYIKEFNSIFQVGRRVVTPIIKYLPKSVSVPDCTFPEEAVKDLISQEGMLFEAGASLMVLQACRACHRRMLRSMYNQREYKGRLMLLLECKEDELPIELGFLPASNIIESIIYGPEIYMFSDQTGRVAEFREKLHNTNPNSVEFFSVNKTSYSSNLLYKEKFKLPIKMDKKMTELKESIGITNDFLSEVSSKRFDLMMDGVDSRDLVMSCHYKLATINVRYGMTSGYLYKAQSLVRANQINSSIKEINKKVPGVRTMVDFTRRILSREKPNIDVVNGHPYKPVIKTVLKIREDFDNKVASGTVSAKRMDSVKKYRKISFINQEVFPSINKSEAYRLYRTPLEIRRGRDRYKSQAVMRYFKLTSEFSEKTIIEFLNEKGNLNALSVNSIFENISALMENKPRLIPSEFPQASNGFENYLSLIRHRSLTGYVYEENKPEILTSANLATAVDIMEITGFIGTVAKNAQDALQLYEACTTPAQRRHIQLSSKNATLVEKYVCYMNSFCSFKDVDPVKLLRLKANVVLFGSASIAGQGVFEGFRTMRAWVTRTTTMALFSNSATYEFVVLDRSLFTGNEQGRQVDLEHLWAVFKEENSQMSSKIRVNDLADNLSTKTLLMGNREFPIIGSSLITSKIKGEEAALNLNNTYKSWTLDTSVILDGSAFESITWMQFKLTNCKMNDHYPSNKSIDLKKVKSEELKSKMRLLTDANWDFDHMEMDDLMTVARQYCSEEEIMIFENVFDDMDMPDWMLGFVMQTGEASAYMDITGSMAEMNALTDVMDPNLLATVAAIEEDTNNYMAGNEDSDEKENFSSLDTIEASVFQALVKASAGHEMKESYSDPMFLIQENIARAGRISKRAMYSKVCMFMFRNLEISANRMSSLVNSMVSRKRRRGEVVDMSRLAYDLLMALKRETHECFGMFDKSKGLFILMAKPFLVAALRKEENITIEKHNMTPYITDIY